MFLNLPCLCGRVILMKRYLYIPLIHFRYQHILLSTRSLFSACLRSCDAFHKVTYYIKWVTTFLTYSITNNFIEGDICSTGRTAGRCHHLVRQPSQLFLLPARLFLHHTKGKLSASPTLPTPHRR